jgi:hypothetical protein
MTIEQLDAVQKAQSFKPYTIHLADGTSHDVRHPEFLWRTPGGRTVVIAKGDEEMAILDLLLVTKITIGNGKSPRRKAS